MFHMWYLKPPPQNHSLVLFTLSYLGTSPWVNPPMAATVAMNLGFLFF